MTPYKLCRIINEYFFTTYTCDAEVDFSFLEDTYGELLYEFCDTHYDSLPWGAISICNKMNESFIEHHWYHFDWMAISLFQELSSNFIIRHYGQVSIENIAINSKIPIKTKLEVRNYLVGLCNKDSTSWNMNTYEISRDAERLEKYLKEYYGEFRTECPINYSIG